jgi:hypothetical protein
VTNNVPPIISESINQKNQREADEATPIFPMTERLRMVVYLSG